MKTEPTKEELDIWDRMKEEDDAAEAWHGCIHDREVIDLWRALAITAVVMCLGFAVVFWKIL